ncbi:pyrroline-5-carboxylate reductase [Candidatus Dependentiae bacterium]|nr:pyrroline-5-carboxylate reductase [Candidatus Dependentiae bacterium]
MKLGIIGCGNMAEAILNGILKSGKIKDLEISVIDIDKTKIEKFVSASKKIKACETYKQLFEKSEYIILSVKPQNFSGLFKEIKEYILSKHILVSIAAGISVNKISEFADGKNNLKIVRIMPNTPALVFKGMSGIYFNEFINDAEKTIIKNIFESLGKVLVVEVEEQMNLITAVSGSGPAYLFYFAECFIKAAQSLGFDYESSRTLVYSTIEGASKLMIESNDSAEQLRRKVTSPGGTTEAAIKCFSEHKFEETVIEAVKSAKNKADELGK